MYNYMSQGEAISHKIVQFAADTRADIANLPTSTIEAGSSCIVIEDSSVWMLNSEKQWIEI